MKAFLKVVLILFTATIGVMLVSCSKQATLILYNRSGAALTIIGPDGTSQNVADGQLVTSRFPATDNVLMVKDGTTVSRFVFSHYPPREYRGAEYPYSVTLAIEADRKIVVCFPDGRKVPSQPNGYPVLPVAENAQAARRGS
jgi:hypothetical protein